MTTTTTYHCLESIRIAERNVIAPCGLLADRAIATYEDCIGGAPAIHVAALVRPGAMPDWPLSGACAESIGAALRQSERNRRRVLD